jgi:hypothetical protein
MKRAFELEWLGGAAERRFRKRRPGIDDLPWNTLDPRDHPPHLVERARAAWTESTFNEYCTAAAFAEVLSAMLAAGAPIDLVGMAGDFVADEMAHVELNARMAMALGGAAPAIVDFDGLVARPHPSHSAFARANELVVRTCCVGESLSVPLLTGTMRATNHPLTRAVLERIVRDEAPHARLGWLWLEWASERMDDDERARLAEVALDALRGFSPCWRVRAAPIEEETRAHVNALGWMEANAYADAARRAVRDEIATPLARFDIDLDARTLDDLLGDSVTD